MYRRAQMDNMDRMMAIQEERLGAELARFGALRDSIITSSKQVLDTTANIFDNIVVENTKISTSRRTQRHSVKESQLKGYRLP